MRAVNFVLFPVLALLIFQVLLGYYAEQGWPAGLSSRCSLSCGSYLATA